MIQRRNSDLDLEERLTRETNRLEEKELDRIATAYRELLDAIGEDLDREGLRHALRLARRAPWNFSLRVIDRTSTRLSMARVFDSEASEIILVKDIELYSMCEHHLLPFIGSAHVAYLPNGKVIGLSKVARIVECFCAPSANPGKSHYADCGVAHAAS